VSRTRRKKPNDTTVEGQEYCPRWHKIGRVGPEGECTPVFCGGGSKGTRPKQATLQDPAFNTNTITDEEVSPSAIARLDARHQFLKVPANLEGDAADKFVTGRLASLAPAALAEVEYRLKLGSGDERYDAALEVLDRTGFGKTDKGGVGSSPIIVINAGGNLAPPWSQRAQTVDAQVVDVKAGVKP